MESNRDFTIRSIATRLKEAEKYSRWLRSELERAEANKDENLDPRDYGWEDPHACQ